MGSGIRECAPERVLCQQADGAGANGDDLPAQSLHTVHVFRLALGGLTRDQIRRDENAKWGLQTKRRKGGKKWLKSDRRQRARLECPSLSA